MFTDHTKKYYMGFLQHKKSHFFPFFWWKILYGIFEGENFVNFSLFWGNFQHFSTKFCFFPKKKGRSDFFCAVKIPYNIFWYGPETWIVGSLAKKCPFCPDFQPFSTFSRCRLFKMPTFRKKFPFCPDFQLSTSGHLEKTAKMLAKLKLSPVHWRLGLVGGPSVLSVIACESLIDRLHYVEQLTIPGG